MRKENILKETELKEFKGFKSGDRVSFVNDKDWLIEKIVQRIIEDEVPNPDGTISTYTIIKTFFVEGNGYVPYDRFEETKGIKNEKNEEDSK